MGYFDQFYQQLQQQQQPTSNRQEGTGSAYSPGLWNWDPNLSWGSNITNRGGANLQDYLTANPATFYGPENEYLSNYLKDTIGGKTKNPYLQKILASGRQSIGRAGDEAILNTQQNLASSGFRGSGTNLIGKIFESKANALGGLEADVGGMAFNAQQAAIRDLLGLNQLNTGVNLGVTGNQVGVAGTLLNAGMGQQQQDQANEGGFDWGGFAGNILSSAAPALIALSDKKLKKDIKDTGMKTESGIPIKTFKYRDDETGKVYMGHIAQEVEKKHPDAVYKVIDYSKLPEGIFREVA